MDFSNMNNTCDFCWLVLFCALKHLGSTSKTLYKHIHEANTLHTNQYIKEMFANEQSY